MDFHIKHLILAVMIMVGIMSVKAVTLEYHSLSQKTGISVVDSVSLISFKDDAGFESIVMSSEKVSDASFLSHIYVEFDNVYKADRSMHGASSLTIRGNASGEVSISNFFIHGSNTLKGTLSGNTLVIPAQTLVSVSGRTVTFCQFLPEEGKYNANGAVTAQVASDGTITIGPWCGVITEGSGVGNLITNGYSSSVCTSTVLKPTNAVMTNISAVDGKAESYGVYIEQPYPNAVTIYNFIDNGVSVDAYVNSDKNIEIAPQPMFTNPQYGTFLCYPADWSGGQRLKGNMTGQSTDKGITFGNWGLFSQSYSQIYSAAYASSRIVFDDGLTLVYPTPLTLVWTGSGTQSDPFVIKTPYDLSAFSESVANGESYQDKYILLGNDIDASKLPVAFRPIGRSEANPFSGHFNGNGHAVLNLSISAGTAGNTGLFGYLDASGAITSLTVSDLKISSYGAKTGGVVGEAYGLLKDLAVKEAMISHYGINGGGIVGYASENTIENCTFEGSMIVGGASGGIAGIVYHSKIRKCRVAADITYPRQTNALYRAIGGVAGYIISTTKGEPEVEDCMFAGTLRDVEGTAHTGGIIGDINGGILRRSFNLGALSSAVAAQNGTFGGLVGLMNSGTISDCYNANQMVASSSGTRVGGLVGCIFSPVVASGRASLVENCYNSGQLVRPSATPTQPVFGTCEPDIKETFRNVYFDNQMNPYDVDGSIANMGLTTSNMTRSTGLNGFDKSVWSFSKGSYPVLVNLAATPASVLSAAPVTFDKKQSLIKVKSDFSVSDKGGVDWFVYTDKGLSKKSDVLTIDGTSVSVEPISSHQTIMGTLGDLWKCYNLITVNASGFAGEGTEENPYLISTKEDLIELDKNISRYGIIFTDEYFLQTNDIDLDYTPDFSGIGSGATVNTAFNGTYDGGGHAIHRMKIDGVAFDSNGIAISNGSRAASAFISYADKKSVIKNVVISSDCRIRGYANVAGIVVATRGRVENCRNYADITAVDSYAAGITTQGTKESSIFSCYNSGTITVGANTAAGIVCGGAGQVRLCQNDGEVRAIKLPESSIGDKAQRTVAGIACALSDDAVVETNVNSGYIHSLRDVAGIFESASRKSTIRGNLNYGTVMYTYTDASCGSISATQLNLTEAADNIYDRQITRFGAACLQPVSYAIGLNTAELTSGQPLSGLDKDAFDWKAGVYPVLKAFVSEPSASAHRQIIVEMPLDETADLFDSSAILSASAQWSLSGNTQSFTISDGKISFHRPENFTTSEYATLTATVGDFSKPIYLRALPLNFSGDGTEAKPFLIRNTDDLNMLSEISNVENFDFAGFYLRQTSDIDFSGKKAFLPIGSGSLPFNGNYDGGGRKICNLVIDQPDMDYAALICSMGNEGFIHDLTLEGGSVTAYRYVGGFVGYLKGKAERLTFASTVKTSKGYPYAGGIVGIAAENSYISECRNQGDISPMGGSGAGIVYSVKSGAVVERCYNESPIICSPGAGIAVVNQGRISDCANNASVSGKSSMGGILVSNGGGDILERCVNNAPVTGTGIGIGGIIGQSIPDTTSYMSDCHNYAEIKGGSAVGGLIGYISKGINMSDCHNEAPVKALFQYAGGIMGHAEGTFSDPDVYVRNCYNTGEVNAQEYAGGIGGYVGINSNLYNCYNTANVVSTGTNAGGIAGISRNIDIVGCWNGGVVHAGEGNAAGITGATTSGSIIQCANFGDVISDCKETTVCNAAGLVAKSSATITSSYNMGKVAAPTCAAGLVGYVDAVKVSMSDSYNAGMIECPGTAAAIILSSRFDEPTISGIYYLDSSFSGIPSPLDAKAVPLSADGFLKMRGLGDGFVYRDNTYPVPEPLSDNGIANFYGAFFSLSAGDTDQNVTDAITVAELPGMEWTSSSEFYISGNKAFPAVLGEGWIQKGTDAFGLSLTRKFPFIVTKTVYNGVFSPEDDEVIATRWFRLDGIELSKPEIGETCIRMDVYAGGRILSAKTIVSE